MLNDAELNRLVRLYNLEDYLFEVVSRRFRESQTLDPYDFFAIVTWKSNRTKTKIMSGLANSGWSVPSLMHEVNAATNPQAKVGALLRVWGIGLALASANLDRLLPRGIYSARLPRLGGALRVGGRGLVKKVPADG